MSGKNQPKKAQPVVENPAVEASSTDEQTDNKTTLSEQPVKEQFANENIEAPTEPVVEGVDQTTSGQIEFVEGSGEQNSQSSENAEAELSESTLVNEEGADVVPEESVEEIEPQPTQETLTEEVVKTTALSTEHLNSNTTKYLEEEGGFEVQTEEGSVIVKPSELPSQELSIVEKQKVIIDEINSEMDRLLEGVSAIKRIPFEQIKQYLLEMAPKKPVSVEHGKIQQRVLIGALRNILNQVDDEGTFTQQFTALLKIFHLGQQHALNELYVFRFLENVEMRNEEIEAFTRIVNMLLITADIKSRKQSLKQLDFEKTLRFGLSDQARRRITEFYGV